jgi:hypothetical protein
VRPDRARAIALAALLALVAAGVASGSCSRKSRQTGEETVTAAAPDSGAASDSAAAAMARAAADSVRAATAITVQSVRVRDWLDSLLAATPGVKVERTEGPFPDHRSGKEADGAGLAVRGTFGALHGAPEPTALLNQRLRDAGWQEDIAYSADGPDGTTFAMRKDGILCFVEGRWDGGDATDPANPPPDDYTVTIQCTRATDP